MGKLLEEREGMSMVQLRGQERDEDEVDDEMDKKKKKKKNIRKKVRDEMKRDKEKKNDVKKQVKKQLTKDLPKPPPVIGANSWLPKPYFKPQPKPFFFPEEEMIICPPEPTACVFPPEMLNRPEAISCGEGLIICKPPEQEFVKPPTVIMGGPPSKFGDAQAGAPIPSSWLRPAPRPPMVGGFKGPLPMELNLEAEEDRTEKVGGPASKFGDEVGSGLPPGASVRGPLKLLEEREGMSMVQLRGQERDEDEVNDEMDKKKKKKKNIRKKVRDEMKRDKEKKNDVKKQVKKQLTKDLPKPPPVIGANSWLPKPYFKPQPKPFFFPEEEMI